MARRRSTVHRLSLVVAAALSLTGGSTQVAAGAGCTTAWTAQTAPGLPAGAELTAIAGLSASEAWAVGTEGADGLLAHFTGGSWTATRYAVGGGSTPLVLVDDGAGWRRVPVPAAAAGATLRSVSYRTGTDVWLAGSQAGRPAALRWDGSRLRLLTVPFAGFAAAVEAPLTGGLILAGQSGRTGSLRRPGTATVPPGCRTGCLRRRRGPARRC